MRAVYKVIALGCAGFLLAAPASAYTLQSGFTESCHEKLTISAFGDVLEGIESRTTSIPLPEDSTWDQFALRLLPPLVAQNPAAAEKFEESQEARFVLFSLVLGVRFPDIGGHSAVDLNALRRVQADPSDRAQHEHCTRGVHDDGLQGDLNAIEGTKQVLRSSFDEIQESLSKVPADQIIETETYLDYYGVTSLPVYGPVFHLGRAIHTIQDSHAHTIRSDDGMYIYSVLNYVDAIAGTLDPAVDGKAHSGGLDDCNGPIDVLVARAEAVTRGIVAAAYASDEGEKEALEKGFEPCSAREADLSTCGWLEYKPDCQEAIQSGDTSRMAEICCTESNSYCDSKWVEQANVKPSKPYLEGILFCQSSGSGASSGGVAAVLGALLLLAAARRRRATALGHGAALSVLLLCTPKDALAQASKEPEKNVAFGGLEVFGSLFSDTPDDSLLSITFGTTLRAGYRWDHWAVVALVEQNSFVSTEGTFKVDSGTVNLGFGGEFRWANGLLVTGLALGPSILTFDTALDNAGAVGIYVHVRPIGFRWRPVEHLVIVFDPLSVATAAPVLSDPALVVHQYRTTLGVEAWF